MDDPKIFLSCGQYAENERKLGKQIADMTKSLTGHEVFFAQNITGVDSLNDDILEALRNCIGFIAVMHPRGEITDRPEAVPLTRASVWIEQEIAIFAYIDNVEKRSLPVILFKHRSIGLEGIRSLLHA